MLLNQLQAKMVALLCLACKLLQNMQCCNEMVLHNTGVLLHNNNRVLPTLAAGSSHTLRGRSHSPIRTLQMGDMSSYLCPPDRCTCLEIYRFALHLVQIHIL